MKTRDPKLFKLEEKQIHMGRDGVSWCLVPPNLVFQKRFHRDTECCMQTERSLCGLYISQSPHSICMHSSSPVCACRLVSFSRISKHLLVYIHTHTHTHTYIYIPFLAFYTNVNKLFAHLKSVRIFRATISEPLTWTHPCCVGLVAGPLSHC